MADALATAGAGRLEPDRGELKRFIDALFRHAEAGTYVSLRAFPDQGGNSKPFKSRR